MCVADENARGTTTKKVKKFVLLVVHVSFCIKRCNPAAVEKFQSTLSNINNDGDTKQREIDHKWSDGKKTGAAAGVFTNTAISPPPSFFLIQIIIVGKTHQTREREAARVVVGSLAKWVSRRAISRPLSLSALYRRRRSGNSSAPTCLLLLFFFPSMFTFSLVVSVCPRRGGEGKGLFFVKAILDF